MFPWLSWLPVPAGPGVPVWAFTIFAFSLKIGDGFTIILDWPDGGFAEIGAAAGGGTDCDNVFGLPLGGVTDCAVVVVAVVVP